MKKSVLGYIAVGLVSVTAAAAVHDYSERATAFLLTEYRSKSSAETAEGARNIDKAFELIYQNLRTLASLPSIRTIDRHAETLTPEARTTFQMIYNNLASSVSVSEVYVIPADFDPQRLDPVTGQGQAPVIMFDELILNAGSGISADQRSANPESVVQAAKTGPEEVEAYEYVQLAEQAAWFRANYPTSSGIAGLRVPIISSGEVITCDNTRYIETLTDDDRKGVIFSVPFFRADGTFGGMVSAIILTNALRDLLPSPDYALINPGNAYASIRSDAGQHVRNAAPAIARGVRDDRIIYSEVIPLSIEDARSAWGVWAGIDDSRFYASPDYRSLRTLQLGGYGFAFMLLLVGSLSWFFISRDMWRSKLANQHLTAARDEARKAEAEASALALQFQTVNSDIARLNREMGDKVRLLQEAQQEIVRKGRMAQLGQLTATIAHELRNPMGAVRNTAYLIRRKLEARGLDLDQQLTRIDNGITRCDNIIAQLLDFARSKQPDLQSVDVDHWLATLVQEEAQTLPNTVEIELQLGLGSQTATMDPDRMRRALSNVIHNAAEAMTGGPAAPQAARTKHPVIRIQSQFTPRGLEITISDNGPGMTPEVLQQVKEPLFTTKNFGAGLGLPAVERIAELHGGGLDIHSSPGQGATVTIWLPVTQARSDHQAA